MVRKRGAAGGAGGQGRVPQSSPLPLRKGEARPEGAGRPQWCRRRVERKAPAADSTARRAGQASGGGPGASWTERKAGLREGLLRGGGLPGLPGLQQGLPQLPASPSCPRTAQSLLRIRLSLAPAGWAQWAERVGLDQLRFWLHRPWSRQATRDMSLSHPCFSLPPSSFLFSLLLPLSSPLPPTLFRLFLLLPPSILSKSRWKIS